MLEFVANRCAEQKNASKTQSKIKRASSKLESIISNIRKRHVRVHNTVQGNSQQTLVPKKKWSYVQKPCITDKLLQYPGKASLLFWAVLLNNARDFNETKKDLKGTNIINNTLVLELGLRLGLELRLVLEKELVLA